MSEYRGEKFQNYTEWLRCTYAISLLGCPAISVPCGFTASGLPVGLQLVSPLFTEERLLAAAAAFEESHAYHSEVPKEPVVPAGAIPDPVDGPTTAQMALEHVATHYPKLRVQLQAYVIGSLKL